MYRVCHRCGGELPGGNEAVYCPHCGAPQLHMAEGCSIEPAEVSPTTGEMPPPLVRGVEWKAGLRSAGLVALVGVVLNLLATRVPSMSVFSSLWVFGGPILALGLYQRQRPKASMSAGVGARIGLVVGLGTVVGLAISLAVVGVVARYLLHSMAGFDVQMSAWMKVQVEHALATNPSPPELVRYFYSAEFRTGFVLVFLGDECGLSAAGGDAGRGSGRAAASAAGTGGLERCVGANPAAIIKPNRYD